jgi:hypothetical protein
MGIGSPKSRKAFDFYGIWPEEGGATGISIDRANRSKVEATRQLNFYIRKLQNLESGERLSSKTQIGCVAWRSGIAASRNSVW